MNEKKKKKIRNVLIIFIVILAVLAGGILFGLTHTQIIVGMIQKLSASTVNTANLYEPLGEPMEGLKDNGQLSLQRSSILKTIRTATLISPIQARIGMHQIRRLYTFMAEVFSEEAKA